jgi:hypothetical protein
VVLSLPSGRQNENTTDLRIYRTFDGGVAPRDFGLVGEASVDLVNRPVFVDTFREWGQFDVALPKYQMLRVVESDGGEIDYDLNTMPSIWSHINQFQGSLVGVDVTQNRRLWYTPPGTPESSPSCYVFKRFPLDEKDRLIGTLSVGDSLVVLAEAAVMEIRGLPLVQGDAIFNLPQVRKLDGIPGCVSPKAMCVVSIDGISAGAWVSPFGIFVTNGQTASRISDEMNWTSTINQATLSTSVLFYDEQRHLLVFTYDSDGDSINDRYILFHVSQQKPSGFPKWTGPHFGFVNDLSDGVIEGLHRIYSGSNDGNVYLEWNTGLDASNAYSVSGVVPLILKSGRYYQDTDREDYEVFKVSLRHSDFGVGETATVQCVYGRDHNANVSGVVTKSVSIAGHRGTECLIGRSLEWAEFTITHLGSGLGTFTDIRTTAESAGESGDR